ncbi:hypothetical protein ACIQVA_28100 [Streptomyces microflavus]|uniref:hypothetical protein n=1 Tax=Streptomyces microflavus TaxID=1919 RepID=UPI003823B4CC
MLLRAEAVAHAIIDGDFMGQVHPAPEGDPHRAEIVESNLTAVWANFARRGYRRLSRYPHRTDQDTVDGAQVWANGLGPNENHSGTS